MLNTHAALRSQAAGILHEISILHDRIRELHMKLQPVQAQLDAITYSVLTLPSEITSEIFVHCLPDVLSGEDAVNITEAPLLLSRICSQWRQIALSTPKLWTRLDMDLSSREDDCGLDIAQAWLEHSRHHPLSVTLKGPITDCLRLSDSEAFFQTLREHASEIRSLSLDVSIDPWPRMPKLINFSHLGQLSLRLIKYYDDADDEPPEDRLEMFSTSHELHRLLLHQIPSLLLVLPRWDHLRSFTGELYDITECIEALVKMPNLTECAFSMFEMWDDFNSDEVDVELPFCHPKIRSFTLFLSRSAKTTYFAAKDEDVSNSAELLRYVTFPNLESLELLDVEPHRLGRNLASVFRRGSPLLKRLVVCPEELAEEYTMLDLKKAPFSHRPHLTDLEIWYPSLDFAVSFFHLFGYTPDCVPGLTKLVFYCRNGRKEDSGTGILRLAVSSLTERRQMVRVANLRVFHVVEVGNTYTLHQASAVDLDPFREMKARGMDIYIGRENGSNLI